MAIELITGVGKDNHISSNDFRAFNRANFGQGRYILKDADDMAVTVSASTGNITIASGSCLWSGMHIRLPSNETLQYIVPTSGQIIYVYLHYIKDVNTGVETVDFQVRANVKLSTTDNLNDSTVEAYTLFCSFIAYPTFTENFDCDFKIIKSHEELETEVTASQEDVVLFDGVLKVGTNIISESIKNFKYIVFEIPGEYSYHSIQFSDMIGENFAVSLVGNNKWNNKNSLFVEIYNFRGTFTNDTSMKITFLSNTVADTSVVSYYGSDGTTIPLRIIGRERINT